MQGSKIVGWVLLVLGLGGAYGAYTYDYGWTGVVIMLVVAAVGAWMAFSKKEPAQMPMQ